MDNKNKLCFADIAESNQEIENELEGLINQAESVDETLLSNKIENMLKNMMNFFASQVEEIPYFENLTPQQKKIFAVKVKFLGREIRQKKLTNTKEIAHSFIFSILNLLGERGKVLEAEEIINQKSREGLRSFLRKAASEEIYKISNQQDAVDMHIGKNFIHDAVLLGVKKAMQNIGIKPNISNLKESPLKILEEAHKKLQQERLL